jgi:hypothetical protein
MFLDGVEYGPWGDFAGGEHGFGFHWNVVEGKSLGDVPHWLADVGGNIAY